MQQSKSKYVLLESISMADLFKQPIGSFGIFIPVDESTKAIARISSSAKANASMTGKKCLVDSLVAVSGLAENSAKPRAERWVCVKIISEEDVSARSQRYTQSLSQNK
ncbi:hypothetical protein NTH44_003190 [Vibrio metoecus]|nr:hypothetical protein [Vibrio cholerae]